MVRVVIQRHLKEGKKGDLLPLLRELRTVAMHYPGYITGETLADTGDPSIISVLSTWRSLEDWKAWEKSEPRNKLYKKIEPLLVGKLKVTIYQVMATEEK
jgi:antibiotic biosynthesis monooxygenase (ABM) superfamily enzyme